VNTRRLSLIPALLGLCLSAPHAMAGVGQWLRDPLGANPASLKQGVTLPGDDAPPDCATDHDPGIPLSLAEAADLALCDNPQVRITWAEIREQVAGVGEARAAYLPTASGSFTYQRDATTYPGQPSLDSTVTGHNIYGSVGWHLFDFGSRAANRASANHLLAAALAAHSAELQNVLDSLIGAWFNAMATKSAVDARREADALAKQAVAAAQRREVGGAGTHSDVLLAEVASAKATLALSRSQGEYDKARAVLVYTMGLPPMTEVQLPSLAATSAAPIGDLDAWMDLAEHSHPELVSAREQWLAAQQKVRSARSDGRPTVDFGANLYENGYPNQGLQNLHNQQFTLGVTVSVTLFDGFTNHYKVEQAKAAADVQQAQYEDDQHKVLMNLVKAHADALASGDNLQASQNYVEASEAAVQSAQRRYAGGAASLLELLTAQTNLADAHQERVRCLTDWNTARLRLMASAGQLGLDRLDHPLEMAPKVEK